MAYAGQGTPVPKILGNGEWIVEPHIFLSFDNRGAIDLLVNRSVSFDAGAVANGLGVTVSELTAANRAGELHISNFPVAATHGGDRAMRFVFTLRGKTFGVVAEVNDQMPSA